MIAKGNTMISIIRQVATAATFQKGLGVCGAAVITGAGFKFAFDTSKRISESSKMAEKQIELLILPKKLEEISLTTGEEKKIDEVASESHCPYAYTWSAVAAVTAVVVSSILLGGYFLSGLAKR